MVVRNTLDNIFAVADVYYVSNCGSSLDSLPRNFLTMSAVPDSNSESAGPALTLTRAQLAPAPRCPMCV